MDAQPDVLNHNTETVPRLYRQVRLGARYERSLDMLAYAKERGRLADEIRSDAGLGETSDEVLQVMRDLRAHQRGYSDSGPVFAAIAKHLPIIRYIPPDEFDDLKRLGYELGFCACGSRAAGAEFVSRERCDLEACCESSFARSLWQSPCPDRMSRFTTILLPRTISIAGSAISENTNSKREQELHALFEEVGCSGEHLTEQAVKHSHDPNVIRTLAGQSSRIIVGGHFDFVNRAQSVVDNWSGCSPAAPEFACPAGRFCGC